MLNYPVPFSLLLLVVLWLAARIGTFLRGRSPLKDDEREDFGVVQAATLTLLGLIIGFSFSMAVGRYDLRKNYEEAEANAIGTEYFRAGLLPATDAAVVRTLLRKYLELRVLFYRSRSASGQINQDTTRLQAEMWAAVQAPAVARPTPLNALAVSGMNDVLNSQGYTQAAWWNRIPTGAWALMGAIAICSNLLLGYTSRRSDGKAGRFLILPMIVSVSFFLIADLDAPRSGVIRVSPQNLISLSGYLQAP